MSDEPARRVNGALLAAHVGKQVTLMCRVLQNNGQQVIVEASDKAQVTVIVGHTLPANVKLVEFVGIVNANGTLTEDTRANVFGETFDFTTYDELVVLANGSFSKIF